jgi:hypothetical protein
MPDYLPFRKFAFRLIVGAALAMGAVGLFNRIVDPFWFYRDVSIEGFNAVKPKFLRFERHVKPAIVARERPNAITVGSSLSEIGFDPLNPYFTDQGRLEGYNFAVAGAFWPIIQCYFEYALAHAPIQRALVEIRPMELKDSDCTGRAAGLDIATFGELLFSSRALRASVQTVLEQGKQRPSHTAKGQAFYARYDPGVVSRFRELLAQRFRAHQCEPGTFEIGLGIAPPPAKEGPKRQLDLSGLRKVVEMARDKGLELRLVVNPKHAYEYEIEALCGEEFDKWDALKQITQVVWDASGGNDRIQLWLFMGYNAFTAEPVREGMAFWQDPIHHNYELGDMMFEAIFKQPPGENSALGGRLTPANFDATRRRFEEGRRSYIEANPWFYPGLRALLPAGAVS